MFIIYIITIIIIISFLLYFIFLLFPKYKNILSKNKYNYSPIKNITYNKTELIDDYLSSIPSKYNFKKAEERQLLEKFINLKDLTKEINEKVLTEIKANFKNYFISFLNKNNVDGVKYIFFQIDINFGNKMIILNNLIYYSEIVGFKNIILNADNNWYLKDNITLDKVTITVMPLEYVDCNGTYIACFEHSKDPGKLFLVKN